MYPHAVGLKTGYTKKAGRCLVSAAEKDGVLLIAVTLSAPDDWNDHMALYDMGFAQTERKQMPPAALPQIPLIGGESDRAELQAALPSDAVVMREEQLRLQYRLPAYLFAPLAQGQPIGTVEVWAGERKIAVLPVTVSQGVAARAPYGFWKKVAQMWCCLLADIFVL